MTIECPKCQSDNPETASFCADCGTKLISPKDIPVTETMEAPKERRGEINKLSYILMILFVGGMFLASPPLDYNEEEWVAMQNGPGNFIDNASAIATDSSGNVYVTGGSYGSGTYYDYATVAYDSSGNELWEARYNGPGNFYDYAQAIAVDLSGNVYVTGVSEGSGTSYDYATVAYDSSGNELWVARYNGPMNFFDYAQAIAVDSLGNIYVTGWSEGSGTSYDYATVAYDSSGNELWVARYNGPGNFFDYAQAIAVDYSGNIYVTGGSYGSGTYCDYATVAYDSSGNELWVARYNGPAHLRDYAEAIAIDSSGNVYVTGGQSTGRYDCNDYATVAYDSSGNELWVARYNGLGGTWHDYARAIATDSSGNVYVTGWSTARRKDDYDYATVAYDSSGNELWVARYNGPAYFRDYAEAIAVDSSGNVYVTGGSYGGSSGRGAYDYATVAYDSSGNELWVARYDGPANVDDYARAIAVDSSGNVYVTGWSNTTEYSDYATVKYSDPSLQTKFIKYEAGNLLTAGELNQGQSNALIDQNSYQSEIERINLEIKSQGLKWRAGETSLSKLSSEERRLRLGGFVPFYENPGKYIKVEKRSILPSSLDWRSKDGKNYMTTVKNLLGCSSCWAFAVIGTMEAMYNVERGISSSQQDLQYPNLSEQELISCSNCGDCSGGPRWNPGICAEYIKYNGIVNEECFPYENRDAPCEKCSDWSEKLAYITDWGWVTQGVADKDAIINALQDGPLSFWMQNYDDFYDYKEGIYEPIASANPTGPHKVVLVGYNLEEDYWICKNSYGKYWGEDGYFKIKMGVCGTGIWVMKLWGVSINDKPSFVSSIYGRVTDSKTGNPIPKAKVIIKTSETSVKKSTKTDIDGYYTIRNVKLGDYKIIIKKDGYKTYRNKKVKIQGYVVFNGELKKR